MIEKFIRVFCDFSADPLWGPSGSMVAIEDMPIGDGLKLALRAWATHYEWCDDTGTERSYSGSFPTLSELKAHSEIGLEISRQLKKELPDWNIYYLDKHRLEVLRKELGKTPSRKQFEYAI